MDTGVSRDPSFLGKMPGRNGYDIAHRLSLRQFANSTRRRREASLRSLANLHGPFRLLLLFSFSFLPIPTPSPSPLPRCCWPVRFLALKIYSLYKWNPMSHAPRPLLGDSCRIASREWPCALSWCVYCFRVLWNIIAARSWIAASSQGRSKLDGNRGGTISTLVSALPVNE